MTIVRESIQDVVRSIKDTPLPLIVKATWERRRWQIVAIACMISFITAVLMNRALQIAIAIVCFVALPVLVVIAYHATKKEMLKEYE